MIRNRTRNSTPLLAPVLAMALLTACALPALSASAADHAECPLMKSGDCPHHQGVIKRGDAVMGFGHESSTHHFRLLADGGVIEAEATDAKDTATRDKIRAHLAAISARFAKGDFSLPKEIHVDVPPAVATLERLHEMVTYTAEETAKGGRLRIRTTDPYALVAVHEFLRFQIADHETGDSSEVEGSPSAAAAANPGTTRTTTGAAH